MVTADGQEAAAALARGASVVLIVGPDQARAQAVSGPGPGRLAVLVGEVDDPATWDAARAMEGELFPAGPTTGR